MPERTNIAYLYDGTLNGFFCCVFESYDQKELPAMVLDERDGNMTLLPVKRIYTNPERAERVEKSIRSRISQETYDFVDKAFMTCLPEREMHLLKFLRAGFRVGGSILSMTTNDVVYPLYKAVSHLEREAHLYHGFVRFKSLNGALVSVIEPKNRVLKILAPHFCDRFQMETFMIYDKTHEEALIYQNGRHEILPLRAPDLEKAYETVEYFSGLWKSYYKAVGIKERENPKCRMSHMPKRYWKHMPELSNK